MYVLQYPTEIANAKSGPSLPPGAIFLQTPPPSMHGINMSCQNNNWFVKINDSNTTQISL